MRTFKLVSLLCLVGAALSQNVGTQKTEEPLNLPIQVCTAAGQCTTESDAVVLDANWRWTHANSGTNNCYTGNVWDSTLCSTPDTCTTNCAIDGVPQADWQSTYGAGVSGNELSLKYVTQGPFSRNVGSRTYLLDSSKNRYRIFRLVNKEFTFDVDVSQLECGLNGALYFVEMDADGGASKYPTNRAGAKYGTGYCDAQCPHDIKWINGKANSGQWVPSPTDPNSGKGHFGSCCDELDIWEANKFSQAFTTHPCTVNGQTQCEGVQCGDNDTGDRYRGVCDKDGCDFASYRLGDRNYYGPGLRVNTNQKLTVVTQFISSDGTDNGDLTEVRRFYVQNGQRIANSQTNLPGVQNYDKITEQFCTDTKRVFNDTNDHIVKGGLRKMGQSMKNGMVLVMSLWDDHDAKMLWLDSNFPVSGNPSTPGISRGPCPTSSGVPAETQQQFGSATVKFSNIKFGAIGSTTGFL